MLIVVDREYADTTGWLATTISGATGIEQELPIMLTVIGDMTVTLMDRKKHPDVVN